MLSLLANNIVDYHIQLWWWWEVPTRMNPHNSNSVPLFQQSKLKRRRSTQPLWPAWSATQVPCGLASGCRIRIGVQQSVEQVWRHEESFTSDTKINFNYVFPPDRLLHAFSLPLQPEKTPLKSPALESIVTTADYSYPDRGCLVNFVATQGWKIAGKAGEGIEPTILDLGFQADRESINSSNESLPNVILPTTVHLLCWFV